tara:strand:- start:333 stop:740 length:408 start_codon:yes stop_codon:yes gene_type:complete
MITFEHSFSVGSILAREEAGYKHIGVVDTDGRIIHFNADGHFSSNLEGFRQGKELSQLSDGIPAGQYSSFLERKSQALSSGSKYSWGFNNCEHFAYYIRDGISRSPQVLTYGLCAFIAVVGIGCVIGGRSPIKVA